MAARKWPGRPNPSLFLTPYVLSALHSPNLSKPSQPLPPSKHRRLVSDCPISKAKLTKPNSDNKLTRQSTSPQPRFNDLNHMFDHLSRKLSRKSLKLSPYKPPQHMHSPVSSPKAQKPLKQLQSKLQSHRVSLSIACSRVSLKYEDGTLKTPKLYEQQIFRDVFDETGCRERVLYSSDEDSALEIYEGCGERLQPQCIGRKEPKTAYESRSDLEPDKKLLGPELLHKLQSLHNRSQSDTACEEYHNSRKP